MDPMTNTLNTLEMDTNVSVGEQQLLPNVEPPVNDWCFDLMVFYRSIGEEDQQAANVLEQLETYAKFSFIVNGLITCVLASFGLLGNAKLFAQLRKSRYFSRRLAVHLTMLCAWDMLLLMSCLFSYGIMAAYYGIIPFVGLVAYLLYLFQPFASFCVTGTIWTVLAISVERYLAVFRPLEQRTRNAQFSLRIICGGVAILAFLLNMLVVPFERRLTDCYEFTQDGFRTRTMIVQQEIVNNHYYAILVHLIPDLIFRAPIPIVLIAFLTIRTVRMVGTQGMMATNRTSRRSRNIPFMLTLLNLKFILCNTLYVFNTILMEVLGYGGKSSSQQSDLEMEQYIRSLYLTDFSNMLLALHSATNWLIFFRWPRCGGQSHHSKKVSSAYSLNSNNNEDVSMLLDLEAVEAVYHRFSVQRLSIAQEILASLCLRFPRIRELLIGGSGDLNSGREELWASERLLKAAGMLADVIGEILEALSSGQCAIWEWRDLCRRIGYTHYQVTIHLGPDEWKMARDVLVSAVAGNKRAGSGASTLPVKWPSANARVRQLMMSSNLQRIASRTFNYALRELKSGALCAIVDIQHHQHQHHHQRAGHSLSCRISSSVVETERVIANGNVCNGASENRKLLLSPAPIGGGGGGGGVGARRNKQRHNSECLLPPLNWRSRRNSSAVTSSTIVVGGGGKTSSISLFTEQ